MDDNGTVAMAFMGTGVYLFQHGEVLLSSDRRSCHELNISILSSWSNCTVVDFEGINLLQSDGTWGQMPGLPHETGRVNNALKHVGKQMKMFGGEWIILVDCGIKSMELDSVWVVWCSSV